MIRTLSGALALLALSACNSAGDGKTNDSDTSNQTTVVTQTDVLSEQEKTEGWTALFDGQSTRGWHKYGGAPAGSAWKVSEGALWLDDSKKYDKDPSDKTDMKILDGGDLTTDEEYDNFHLKLEWKVDTGANSGIIFYVVEDTVKYPHPYETGPEMQVLDNERHPDGKINKHRSGDLYDLIACSKETVKPAGEWNQVEIKSLNGKLDFFLNGENVVSTTLWDENWKTMVANSKFKQWKDFGVFKKGKICLQDHDNKVWYRNIRIKRL